MKTMQSTRVSELMSRDVKTCSAHDVLSSAAQLMWDHDCGFVPVVEYTTKGQRRPVGVITDRDVCMAAHMKGLAPAAIRVGEVMSRGVRACRSDDTPEAAEEMMRQHRIRRLPVVDAQGDLVGVLSLNDLVRWAARERGSFADGSPFEGVGATLAAVSEPWRSIRSKSAGVEPSRTGARFERGGMPGAEAGLARRQASDEQC